MKFLEALLTTKKKVVGYEIVKDHLSSAVISLESSSEVIPNFQDYCYYLACYDFSLEVWSVVVIFGSSVLSIQEKEKDGNYPEVPTYIFDFFEKKLNDPKEIPSQESKIPLAQKKEMLAEYLQKNRVECEVLEDKIRVLGCVEIHSPFSLQNIYCQNEIVLKRVKNILAQSPLYNN